MISSLIGQPICSARSLGKGSLANTSGASRLYLSKISILLRKKIFFIRMKGVEIPLREFIAEHKKLVKVLRSGSKEQRLQEAKEQYKELMKKIKR